MFTFFKKCPGGTCPDTVVKEVPKEVPKETETERAFKKESVNEPKYLILKSGDCVRTYDSDGKLHSYDDKPAVACPDNKEWYDHGLLHRDIGPAIISQKNMQWAKNGLLSRKDGPTVECADGGYAYHDSNNKLTELYRASDGLHIKCKNGVLHNPTGPAFKSTKTGVEFYFINGKPVQGYERAFNDYKSRNYESCTNPCDVNILLKPQLHDFDKR